jgi:D-Tyr-tRNAtyr deacylase
MVILQWSQFTLHAATKRESPLIHKEHKPEIAIPLYEIFVQSIQI